MKKKTKANFLVKKLGDNYGWAVCIACMIQLFCASGLGTTGFSVYQPYLIRLGGLTNTQSSTLIMIRTFVSLLGLAFAGRLIDLFEAKRVVVTGMIRASFIFYTMVAVGGFLCSFAGNGSIPMAVLAVSIMGIGLAVSSVSISMYASGASTGVTYAQTVTRFQLAFNLGSLLFGRVPGMIADRTGSYIPAFQIMAAAGVVSAALLLITYAKILRDDANRTQNVEEKRSAAA